MNSVRAVYESPPPHLNLGLLSSTHIGSFHRLDLHVSTDLGDPVARRWHQTPTARLRSRPRRGRSRRSACPRPRPYRVSNRAPRNTRRAPQSYGTAQYFPGESCGCARMLRDHLHATIPIMHKYLISAVVIAAIAPAAGAGAAPAPAAHWCLQGDPPLHASADTMCGLAGSVITDYVNVCHESRNCQIRVDSRTSRTRYLITCNRRGGRYTGTVYCHGPADADVWTRFSALV